MTDERAVLVTGGARGIGRAIAEHLAEKGWKVIATFNTGHDEAMDLARRHGVAVRQLDMTDRSATLAFARQIRTEFAVEALVNNAGLIAGGPVDVLITHDAPAGVPLKSELRLPPDVVSRADRTRALLRDVVDVLAPPHVFCGHWHQRRIQELTHPDGRVSRVDVLDKEYSREGNAVLVWPGQAPLRIEPLFIRGN
jgi:NAD(P)-dependent dehydrogenase (short-subunit alcohol dehydrogenase family)